VKEELALRLMVDVGGAVDEVEAVAAVATEVLVVGEAVDKRVAEGTRESTRGRRRIRQVEEITTERGAMIKRWQEAWGRQFRLVWWSCQVCQDVGTFTKN
jgi:hypothetical protein